MRTSLLVTALFLVALALPARAAAQDGMPFNLDPRPLQADDAARAVALLDAWTADVRAMRSTAADPLTAHRRRTADVVAPPAATYYAACSAASGGPLFTMNVELTPAHLVRHLDVLQRVAIASGVEETPDSMRAAMQGVPALLPDSTMLTDPMSAMQRMMALQKTTASLLPPTPMASMTGPTNAVTARVLAWYEARGSYEDPTLDTEHSTQGVNMTYARRWNRERTVLTSARLASVNGRAATSPLCAHLPRGTIIEIAAEEPNGPPEGRSLEESVVETAALARILALAHTSGFEDAGDSARINFEAALSEQAMEASEAAALLHAVADAEWLAAHPSLQTAIAEWAERHAGSRLAGAVRQQLENVAWYQAHGAAVGPAFAALRAAFQNVTSTRSPL